MSKQGLNWWHGLVVISLVAILPVIGTFWYSLLNPAKAYNVQKQALKSNHEALLSACREMLANRDKFRNDWEGKPDLDKDDKVIDAMKGITPDIPKPIRELKPRHIIIRTDRVEIHLSGPYAQYIQGFKEGIQGTGSRMLTNGLWYVKN